MNIEKVKANIRAMLNLANDSAATEGEINNAMRFVAKLMEQHHLTDEDLSEVDDKILELERKATGQEGAYFQGHKVSEWECSVASFCCVLLGVKYYIGGPELYRVNGVVQYFPDGKRMTKRTIQFYGIAEDVEIARQLFLEITTTIASLGKLKWGGVFRGEGREYCTGFVAGIWDKYREDQDSQLKLANKDTTKTSKSTALVAIESRELVLTKKLELAEAYLKKSNIKLKGSIGFSSKRTYNGQARADGRADGQRHNVSVTRNKKLRSS